MIDKNSYNFDVYRINLEKVEGFFNLQISNVISWDGINVKMTSEELKEFIDFIKNISNN